jgi:hypothetical protein
MKTPTSYPSIDFSDSSISPRCCDNLKRCPLTPTLSPNDEAIGGEGVKGARNLWDLLRPG